MEQSEKYKEGYAIGLTWNHDWIPGGPWIYCARYSNNPERIAMEEKSIRENLDWNQGWNDGVAFAKENKCT